MISTPFHSLLLAHVFGLYLFIMGIILLCRRKFYRDLLQKMKILDCGLIISSSFGLILGLFLVGIHNIWTMDSQLVVTVLGWLILVKSVLWLALPEKMLEFSKKLYSGPGYYITAIILIVVGVFLMMKGHSYAA